MKKTESDYFDNERTFSTELDGTTRHRRPLGSDAGFTLVELIVVAAILGVLAAFAMPAYNKFIEGVKVSRAMSEIRSIEKDIVAHLVDTNAFPNSLNDIGRGSLRDPWGNFYQYLNIANGGAPRQDTFFGDLNTDFDLYSLGVDGLTQQVVTDPNGMDDIVRAGNGAWTGLGETY